MRLRRSHVVALALAAASCAAENTLEGSLSEQVSLDFDAVEIQRSATAIAVTWTLAPPGGGGRETVFKITAATESLALDVPISIDLAADHDGAPRGAAARAVSSDSRRDFPLVKHGFLRFDAAPTIGAPVTGAFSVLFDQGGSLGAGRTVFGDFTATVAQAGQ